MNYLISYDLNKSGKNYDGVYKAIKDSSTGKWCKPADKLITTDILSRSDD